MKSRILEFIKNNPDTWEEKLNEKFIHSNHSGDLVCFKYESEADFSDPLVCEARGIIIDVAQLVVVCWPFDKFFNVQEKYAEIMKLVVPSSAEKLIAEYSHANT